MRAAVFRGIRRIELERVPDPVAGSRDIVLAVKACGVCGTDVSTYTKGLFADPGQIMGHEFAGEVVEVGSDVDGIAAGDRVTGLPIQPCGDCRRCREGGSPGVPPLPDEAFGGATSAAYPVTRVHA